MHAAETYVVRQGDTLATIAAERYGSPDRWQEIGTLNGIDDPRDVTVGQTIKLPGSAGGRFRPSGRAVL